MENKPNTDYEERNATLDEDEVIVTDDDTLRDELLEESGMNSFQKYIARMDDKKWELAQWITGVILGIIAAVALFWDTISTTEAQKASGGIFSIPLVIAILVAMVVPNIIEKQGMRRANKLRIAVVAALLAGIIGYMAYIGLTRGFH